VSRPARWCRPACSPTIAAALRAAGADAVFAGEGETALAMSAYLMRELGATDEQIDRERERVRKELF